MITINGLNKWTPAIYKSESPVDWAAERNRSINFGKKRKAQPVKKASNIACLLAAK